MPRAKFLVLCKAMEKDITDYPGSVRDEVTGPLVDALHDENQVVRKVLSDGAVFDFLYRTKIARDFVLSSPVNPDHVWEPQTTKLLVHLARRCSDVLIGGAYFGDQAILMARAMSASGGRCHAFEPNKDQLAMLRHNAGLNGLQNIRSWELGLWSDSSAHLRLVGNDSFAYSEPAASDSEGSFATIAVDQYCEQQGIDRLGLIMLDIEGRRARCWKAPVSSWRARQVRHRVSSSRCIGTMSTGPTAWRTRRSHASSLNWATPCSPCVTSTPMWTCVAGRWS